MEVYFTLDTVSTGGLCPKYIFSRNYNDYA